jgi:hypothetical protein
VLIARKNVRKLIFFPKVNAIEMQIPADLAGKLVNNFAVPWDFGFK